MNEFEKNNMDSSLQNKVNKAIRLIQSAVGNNVVEVSYSGGKDSDVILELTKMAGVKYRAIYKNTTIDPPKTISHCKKMGAEVFNPLVPFFKLIERKGMPTRRARFCCEFLKEYKVLDIAIQGIRRCESSARAKRYDASDPIVCRTYGSKKNHVNVILPILEWTDKDVADFIKERGLQCHPLYYDEQGNFHPERRLGCMGCPMRSDAGLAEFKANPKLFKQWVKATKVWWDSHPNSKSQHKFETVYGLVAHNIFFKSYQEWLSATHNLFEDKDWKRELEDFFKIDLP